MYGITKVAGELLCQYYAERYDVDVRSLRFPGIISCKTSPGGGTTDYAVEIFYEAIKNRQYVSFVGLDTILPMMYMPDCIKSTMQLMNADSSKLKSRCYNLAAMSFSVKELAEEIKKYIPEFKYDSSPDFRQKIADSWPKWIDDGEARKDWQWSHEYDLARMTKDMIEKISEKLK
jgi:nucleoside-diphosphate-sugar epimerase